MNQRKAWASALVAAVLSSCGPAAERVASTGASVTPVAFGAGEVVTCSSPELGLPSDVTQVTIGTGSAVGLPPWDPAYPYPVDLAGMGEAMLSFSGTNTIVDFSVTGEVRVVAALVRAFDTGTNAYVYGEPGVASDSGLTTPAASAPPPDDDRRIAGVKLCVVPVVDEGCTLTYGYWKTHSALGPAPYDATWAGREDDPFFESGLTWYEVLDTPPAGNPYFILAHQFIAAQLNLDAGAAWVGDEFEWMDEAIALFSAFDPDDVPNGQGDFLELAGFLADYNEGRVGPGHCDD
jgi:hypothetical protein